MGWLSLACRNAGAESVYFGEVDAPREQVLRYISGPEPETLDPQLATSQPDARILMAFFDGLVEYDPKTLEPIPAIAERWEVNADSSEFVFHLRRNARWSNGDAITTADFVYSLRRGLSPELASRNASLAYYIKYAQGFNNGGMFVRDKVTGEFVTENDVAPEPSGATPANTDVVSDNPQGVVSPPPPASEFRRFINAPTRLVVAGDEKARAKEFKANPKLEAALAGKELVPVVAENLGVEAIDDHTLRITLTQPAPFFVKLLPHQFFRIVPRKTIEKHGAAWTQPANIVTCGAFKLDAWKPYDVIAGVRDPVYWDAGRVKLDKIYFYPLDELTTMMNLYKAGEVDAIYNHSVPKGWIDRIRPLKDYMDEQEAAIFYYCLNVKKPPMNDLRVRKALNMAIDKEALAKYRVVNKPLTAFTPEGIFPGYPQFKGDGFDVAKAKTLLVEAGYKDAGGGYDPKKFPIADVEITYNTSESNRQTAEFIQAQWKQNLGLTVPLKNMEFKTFLPLRSKLDYKGIAQGAWSADYMDPFTFLNLFYTDGADNGTGWSDPKYSRMLDDANRTLDPAKRYELLAKAEAFLLDAQPIIPLMTTATNWVKKPYVKGLYPNAGTLHAWKYVYIEPDSSKWEDGE
jgi:oligopeptide transport system substrate-binding protein